MLIIKKIIKIVTLFLILSLGLIPYTFFDIHVAWNISISIVWGVTFLIFFEIIGVKFFINPKKILTDHGYKYVTISEDVSEHNGHRIMLCLYSDNFFYWKHVNELKSEHKYINTDSKLKIKINYLCTPKELTPFEKVIVQFNTIDISTDKKEILRDLNIDKILKD